MGYNKYGNNGNDESLLEWKNHNGFYTSLNNLLDSISITETDIFKDKNNIFKYFAQVNSLFSKHYGYVKNKEVIATKIINIRDGLYDKTFLKTLEEMPDSPKLQIVYLRIYDNLSKIYREILNDLKNYELLPNPKDIEIDPTDEKRRGLAI